MATPCSIRVLPLFFVVVFAISLVTSRSTAQVPLNKTSFKLPPVPQPADNRITPDRVRLGKMLFFDPRLSGSNKMSCSSCHDPAHEWADALPTAIGRDQKILKRATPSLINAAFNSLQMWDGRFHSLEEQATGPILSVNEMNGVTEQIIAKLQSIPAYVSAFNKAYPGEGVSKDALGKAVACFERTIIERDTPFDHWIDGDEKAINSSAKQGFRLFVGKANCVACHQAPNFTDEGFHNIGLKGVGDEGRYAIVPIKRVQGAFKTPSLRDVALTPPYMHDGSYRTLEEVIDHYDRGGDDKQNLDPNMKPLNLTQQEKKDLVEFLKSLACTHPDFSRPRLPQMYSLSPKERP